MKAPGHENLQNTAPCFPYSREGWPRSKGRLLGYDGLKKLKAIEALETIPIVQAERHDLQPQS